ncbi:MAG: GAF domain-containing protein, partial [Polyangiaceae bacterium]
PAPAPAPVAHAPVAAAAPVVVELRPPSVPSVPAGPRARVRGVDLIADLFEAMHDLHFVRDALEGGEFCLALAMEKLPCQSGLVHLFDFDKREFIVTSTRGAGASALLLRRHPESEALLLAAARKRRAIVVEDGTQAEGAQAERYKVFGGARSLLVAPVLLHGRLLGAVELVNPLDGQPFNESEGNALTYIAEQFAEFISSHGIVTDAERISQRPAT